MDFKKKSGILLSEDAEIIAKCVDASDEINCELRIKFDIAEIILELQDNQYDFTVLDCCNKNNECVNWVKVIKKIRSELPVIIISNDVKQELGAKLYEQNIFYLFISQESKELLTEIFTAAINHSHAH